MKSGKPDVPVAHNLRVPGGEIHMGVALACLQDGCVLADWLRCSEPPFGVRKIAFAESRQNKDALPGPTLLHTCVQHRLAELIFFVGVF